MPARLFITRVIFIIAVVSLLGCGVSETLSDFDSADPIDAETDLGIAACELLLPFAKSVSQRKYESAYDALDAFVFQDVHARQFLRNSPRMESTISEYKYIGDRKDRIGNVDKAKFVQFMKDAELEGIPSGEFEVIEEWNFVEDGEPMAPSDRRFSDDFPFDKVVASVTIVIDCVFDEQAKQTFADSYDPEIADADLYFNILVYVVEDEDELKPAFVDFQTMHLDQY